MDKTKILVIVGTTRSGRVGRRIAEWYLSEAEKVASNNVEFELLDIAEYDLPVFNEAATPSSHQYNELQNQLAEKIGPADGFVFVTGEYNHSVPGSLKNFMDYIGTEWAHKAAAFVSYGSQGGVRAVEHLIQILTELRVASVAKGSDNINITAPWEALDEQGVPKDGYVHGNIENQIKGLVSWANAFKTIRQ